MHQLQTAFRFDGYPALLAGPALPESQPAGLLDAPCTSATLATTMAAIGIAIVQVEQHGGGAVHLRNLESHLVTVLTTMARNPGIEAAADDLFRAAAAFVRAEHDPNATPGPRLSRLLKEALARLQDRILSTGQVARS